MLITDRLTHLSPLKIEDHRELNDFLIPRDIDGMTYYDIDMEKIIEKMQSLLDRLNF